jgi:hypothetical protein
MPPRVPPDPADEAYAALMRAGEQPGALRAYLEERGHDAMLLAAVLRRPVPPRLLELVSSLEPWSTDHRLLAAVVLNPRVPRALALRLVSSLLWRELAEVAQSLRVDPSVRVRAEGLLQEMLPDLRLGERITLARLATPAVLPGLLADGEPMVVDASLTNPRLSEEQVTVALRRDATSAVLPEAVAASRRWGERYAVRLALVLQPRTPLGIALGQLRALLPRDLDRVGEAEGLRPVVQIAAWPGTRAAVL